MVKRDWANKKMTALRELSSHQQQVEDGNNNFETKSIFSDIKGKI